MSEESLTIRVRKVNQVAILDLEGRLIMGEPVEKLDEQVSDLLKAGTKCLAINLGGLTYVDSTGIASMVDAATGAKDAGAKCKFFAATSRVLQLLRIARVDTAFVILADEDSVISSFASS
jgi:anti-sigma B factor antagonist